MALNIVPTGEALGADVRGVDLSAPVDDATMEALRDAWTEHLVLLFRGQSLDDPELLDAARIFGELQVGGNLAFMQRGRREDSNLMSLHPEITIVSNLDEDGRPTQSNTGLGSDEVVWHSDNSYIELPPAGSMLYAIELPVDGGGDTSFNNQFLAYETLPADLKTAIEGKSQRHDSSRNSAGVLRPSATLPATPEEVEGPVHPLVRLHPATGRKALYLGRRRVWPSNYIIGLSNEESEALLDRLWDHATKPEFAWTHRWRVGDVVLWDNRCAMHFRSEVDPTQSRVMHRTQIAGEAVRAG